MADDSAAAEVLARCNGYLVSAGGTIVGAVATPVFSGTKVSPDSLLVRAAGTSAVYRKIPLDLIAAADAASETIFLTLEAQGFEALPHIG
jgi:hypothetical protein